MVRQWKAYIRLLCSFDNSELLYHFMIISITGKPEYKGAGDVLRRVINNEGFFSLWKGFTPYYFRLGPHTVLTFIFLEQMNKSYKLHVLGIQGGSGGL